MTIDELVSPDDVTVGMKSPDKPRLISELAALAAVKLHVDADDIVQELMRREGLGSTGLGNGLALPHARMTQVDKPRGFVARLKKPIEFDAIDGKPIDVAVLVLLPSGPQADQLNALACVARVLREPGALERVRLAKDSSALYRELVRR